MEASRTQHRPRLSDAKFDDLVRTHRAPLERFARSLGASREDAEELAATALLRAYESPPAARHANEWRSWLSTVTRNLWIDARRRRELRLVRGDGVLEAIPSSSGTLEQVADTAHEARQICAAMALLPPAQRAAIYLREFRGLTYEEIAAELGMTTSVVTATLERARATVTQRRGRIACALSALAVSPFALLRSGARAARLASAPSAAAKIAVPVMLVAGAGGAGVLATTEHASRIPLRAMTSAAGTAPASAAIMRAFQAGAQAAALSAGARHARRAATPARAVATVRPPAAAKSPKATVPTRAGADTGTPHTAATPAGAAPDTVTQDSQPSGTPRPPTHATPARDSSSAGAHASRRAAGRASPAPPRADAPAARTGSAGRRRSQRERSSARLGGPRNRESRRERHGGPALARAGGPRRAGRPAGNGGAGAPSGAGAPTSASPTTTAAAAPADAPPADTPGPAEGQTVGAQAQARALPHGQLSGS